jgi:hypothetical protein
LFFTSGFRERASGELVADVRHADPYHPEADFWSNSAKNLAVFPEKWIRRAIGLSLVKSQPKTGKAGANPSQQDVADQSQPQPTFWQRLFRHKETKKAKPGKPGP